MFVSHCNTAARLLVNPECEDINLSHKYRHFLEVAGKDRIIYYDEYQKSLGSAFIFNI